MSKASTVRFTDEIFARLDQASSRTGLPVNSIVVAACLEWMQRHVPSPVQEMTDLEALPLSPGVGFAPRWATLRRAVKLAVANKPTSLYLFHRFTERAKTLLTLAQEEAERWGHSYIGTEHLLIAAFGSQDFYSAQILKTLDIGLDDIRSKIEEELSRPSIQARSHIIPTSRVKRVIEIAFDLCSTMSDPRVGTNHLLLALAAEGQGIAAHVLKDLGATRERIESELAQFTEPEP